MARQRQVFERDTVAHLWAHKGQDSARDKAGSLYFTGPTIYSYGSHFAIAHIFSDECGPDFAGRVLWNGASYSNTTSKHQWMVRRALTGQQRETMLEMPAGIGTSNWDALSIDRDLRAKRLPAVASLLAEHVVYLVAELPMRKRDATPWRNLLNEADKAETLAVLMYKRAGKKYPLPMLPKSSDIPAEKTAFLAWVKTYAAGKMRKDYATASENAKTHAVKAREFAARCTLPAFPYCPHEDGAMWQARNTVERARDAALQTRLYINGAEDAFKALNDGKKAPAALLKLRAEMLELENLYAARFAEFTGAEKRDRLIYAIREMCVSLHTLGDTVKRGDYTPGRRFQDGTEFARRAAEVNLTDPVYLGLANRLARVCAAMEAREALRRAAEAMSVSESFVAAHFHGDVVRHAGNVGERLSYIERLDIAPRMRENMASEIDTLKRKAAQLQADAKAAIVAREADKLRAWLAGESDARPSWEAGTFARINGNIIETTRGASVPIEHGCRLARLYAVTVRRGGASWADGAGPMVGHYRVNSIGADGSLVIGCHEFDATEAKRLHALMAACPECAEVTEGVTA